MLVSEYMTPYLDCVEELERWLRNLDLILPVKAKLLHWCCYGMESEYGEFCKDWFATTTILCNFRSALVEKYEDEELVDDAMKHLAQKYIKEMEEINNEC